MFAQTAARGGRVLRRRPARARSRPTSGRVARQALRRAALVQAVLPLRREATGSRAIPRSRRPRDQRLQRPQPRVDAPLQRRRHLDAGQVGVSRGTRRGISRSTASRSRSSIRTSPRSSSRCCCASGTCTRTGSCRPTSGRSATSTRRCTRGRRGASTRSSRSAAASATVSSSSASSTSCCSTSPGG